MTKILCLALLTVGAAVASCSSHKGGQPGPDRSLLTAAEMGTYTDAYTAVASLRPMWMRQHGTTSLRQREGVKVYVDGSLLGGVDNLKQIIVASVESIRYLDGMEASTRWGLDHGNGAIVVMTRRQ